MNYLTRHFNHVFIRTTRRNFSYVNTNLTAALDDVKKYCDDTEILGFYAGDEPLLVIDSKN